MGYTPVLTAIGELFQYTKGEKYLINEMEFDSSWGWLMPVVEKIESLHNKAYAFTVDPWSIVIIEYMSGNEIEIVHVTREESKLMDDYFEAVTKFLDWYETYKPLEHE